MKKLLLATIVASTFAVTANAADLNLHDTNKNLVQDDKGAWNYTERGEAIGSESDKNTADKKTAYGDQNAIIDEKQDAYTKLTNSSSEYGKAQTLVNNKTKEETAAETALGKKGVASDTSAYGKLLKAETALGTEKDAADENGSAYAKLKHAQEALATELGESTPDKNKVQQLQANVAIAEAKLGEAKEAVVTAGEEVTAKKTALDVASKAVEAAQAKFEAQKAKLEANPTYKAYTDAVAAKAELKKELANLEEGVKYNSTLDRLENTDVSEAAEKVGQQFKMTDGEVREGVVANNHAINKVADFANENRDMIEKNETRITQNEKDIYANKKGIAQNKADINKLFGEVERLDDRIDGTQASLHAVTNARPFLSGQGKTAIGVGLGNSGSVSAVAVGAAHAFTDQWSASATINSTFGGDDNDFSFGVGTQYEF